MGSFVSEAERTIVHVCGQALVAWYSPSVVTVDEIRLDEDGGKTTYSSLLFRTEHVWERTAINLAGAAAELIAFKTVHSGSSRHGLSEARAMAEELCRSGRLSSPWQTDKRMKGMPFGKMFRTGLTADVVWTMNEAFKHASRIITDYRPGHDRLAAALRMGSGTLNRREIASFFGPRFWGPKFTGP